MNPWKTLALTTIRCASIGTLSLLAGGTSACGMGCSLVGCDSGLTVRVQPVPTVPYSVEAVAPGTNTRYVFRCSTPGQCADAFFRDYLPTRAFIDVVAGADTVHREFTTVKYDKRQPNGEDCDPTCRNAYLTVLIQ